jgi:hypothetical protein
MFPSETSGEIFRHLPPGVQARLSRKNKEVADRRKYESITYPITMKEMEEVQADKFYVIAGAPEKFVWTKWRAAYREENYYGIFVEESQRWEYGELTHTLDRKAYTGLASYNTLIQVIEACRKLTAIAYDMNVCNDENFDYFHLYEIGVKLSNVTVAEFPDIEGIYKIYALRCRKVGLDDKIYAPLLTQELLKEITPFNIFADQDIDQVIRTAKRDVRF